jgi:hypothetical protein
VVGRFLFVFSFRPSQPFCFDKKPDGYSYCDEANANRYYGQGINHKAVEEVVVYFPKIHIYFLSAMLEGLVKLLTKVDLYCYECRV